MSASETFQIPLVAARAYESRFVPAIFADWAPRLVDLAGVARGHAVLDVACGTGVVARTVADRLGGDGLVVGLDLNEAMLTVAREAREDLEWQQGDAADLPFPDRSFDVVLCQMGLMFFPDRARALREMARVVADDGRVGVVVPASLDDQPAYRPFVELAVELVGEQAQSLLGTYWSCGDQAELHALIESAGLRVLASRHYAGTARFQSADELVDTEVQGSPLAARISEAAYQRLRVGSREVLHPFVTAHGLDAPLHGHVVVAGPAPG
ncbi:MAG: methyltransferase domain-containing protein [Pseudonocardia sp.]